MSLSNTPENSADFAVKAIISFFPGYLFWKDTQLRYRGCNNNAAKLFRLDNAEEIVGKTDHDFSWGEELHEQFIKEDNLVINEKKLITREYRWPVKNKDNEYIYIRSEKKPLYDHDNNVIGILTMATDIPRQKLGDLMCLETLLEYLPCHVYWINKDFTMVGCNRNVLSTLGMNSLAEFSGKTYEELAKFSHWPQALAHKLKNDDARVIQTGQPIVNVEDPPIPHANGSSLYLLTNRVPIKDKSGETIGVAGISVDISSRKKLEENLRIAKEKAEVANVAKTEFLENMRHDIRTPLSGIVGCAQLIQMYANNPEKVADYATDLVESSNALLEFLNKILEGIQVATGEIPLLKKKFQLNKILDQVVRLNKPQADLKNLSLYFDYDENIPAYLLGDPIRLQRIALELVTNALKYTNKGEIKLRACLIENKKREVLIELRVSDTGIGIPRAKHHEIYTRFTRLTPSYQGIYPGTGLGLSVVKQFMDELGGEIQLESQPNQGSTFRCFIPLQEALSPTLDESETEETLAFVKGAHIVTKKTVAASKLQEMPVATKSRVLVVEDQVIAAKVAQGALQELNCQVDIAPDGKTALSLVEKNHYDLILMDIGLPDGDGCDVTRRIRLKQWQRNPSVPIIGLTAHTVEAKKKRCLENGMNAIYSKPLTHEKASEILNAFLSHSQAPAAKENREASFDNDKLQSLPLLDKDKALALLGSEETFRELLVLLVSGLSKEIAELKQYHQDKDWQNIERLAHKWKGGTSYCGASRLEEICKEVQTVFRTELPENPEILYQLLLQVAEETYAAARKMIS